MKRDSTAVVACTYERLERRVRLVTHRVFQPSPSDPLDFEATAERTLLDLRRRFQVREIRYDPYQLVAVAQRLTRARLPMTEFPQSIANLTEASSNLYDLIKGRNLVVYPDDDLRIAVSRSVAVETSRGWRIAKEKASHKIDVIVALAQAALGAVRQSGVSSELRIYGLNGASLGRLIYDSTRSVEGEDLAPIESTDLDSNTGANECAGCHALIPLSSRHEVKRRSRVVSVCGLCWARLRDRRRDMLVRI